MNELVFFCHLAVVAIASSYVRSVIALTTYIVVLSLLANLFVLKQIVCFGYEITCSDVFSVGAYISLNMLQARSNAQTARHAVFLSFLFMLFFAIMSWFHLLYEPSISDSMHGSYERILGQAPRIVVASIVSMVVSQNMEVQMFSMLRRFAPSMKLIVCSGISSACAQAVDTAMFTFLGLYGLVAHPYDIFYVSYGIKIVISVFLFGCSWYGFSVRNTSSV